MTMDDDCHYSRCRIVEVKTTMNFPPSFIAASASATMDQRQRRRRQLHRRHAAVHCHHPTNPFLSRISAPSSSSTFYFLVALIALSMSRSSYAFSTSSSSSTKPLAISSITSSSSSSRNTRFGKSIRSSTNFHHRISPSWLPSSSRKRTSQHNLSAVADVPKSSSSSSSSSSPSSNSFQSRMEKLVRRNNSENNKLNNTNNTRQFRNDDRDEDSAGKYSQYGNYNGSNSRWSSSPSNYNNLKTVHTLLEYKQVLDECRREGNKGGKIVVVRFFATWCKACKAIQPSYHRLASLYPNMIFLEVPVTNDNANLHQGLEVPSLPYGHIYHPTSGLVEEMKISRKYFHNLVRMVKWYEDGMCNLDEYVPSLPPPQEEE